MLQCSIDYHENHSFSLVNLLKEKVMPRGHQSVPLDPFTESKTTGMILIKLVMIPNFVLLYDTKQERYHKVWTQIGPIPAWCIL